MKWITDRKYDSLILSKMDKINSSHPTLISSKMPISSAPIDHPEILPYNKVPSAMPLKHQFMIPQLHHYLGFRSLKNCNAITEIAQDTIDMALFSGELPLELGDVVMVQLSRKNSTPIPHPPKFLDVVHMDSGYMAIFVLWGVLNMSLYWLTDVHIFMFGCMLFITFHIMS